jgi:hypothetical protein
MDKKNAMNNSIEDRLEAAVINTYMKNRTGTLADIAPTTDALLLPLSYNPAHAPLSPYAMEISDTLIRSGVRALMAIGGNMNEAPREEGIVILPPILIMNEAKRSDILAAVAAWMEHRVPDAHMVVAVIVSYRPSELTYPLTHLSGTAASVAAELRKRAGGGK